MKTIYKDNVVEIEIKKSKFVSYAYKVTTEQDVKECLSDLQKLHRSANHITYAYVLHAPSVEKCSDDGEPNGTAGKPILDVIKKNDMTNILIAVVRYFGGIKLGAGGLVRAYSNSAKEVIDSVGSYDLRRYIIMKITVMVVNKHLIDNEQRIKILNTDYYRIGEKLIIYNVVVEDDLELINRLKSICVEIIELDRKFM